MWEWALGWDAPAATTTAAMMTAANPGARVTDWGLMATWRDALPALQADDWPSALTSAGARDPGALDRN